MATSYPKFTSVATGKTTWSNGDTSTVKNPTPATTPKSTNGLASVATGISGLLSSLSKLISGSGGSGTAKQVFPVGQNLTPTQTAKAYQTIKKYGSSSSLAKNLNLPAGAVNVYSDGSTQDAYGNITPAPIAKSGIASKQSQPVLNSSGKSLNGAYTTDASGNYYEIPNQSLSQGISPDIVNNVKKTADRMNLTLQDTNNNPWNSNGSKSDLKTSQMEGITSGFSKLFSTPESVDFAYNSNPTIKNALDSFIANGGTLDQIKAGVQKQAPATYNIKYGDTLTGIAAKTGKSIADLMVMNPQITNPDKIYAGDSLNLGAKTQDTTSYLAELNNPTTKSPAELMNLPLDQLTQDEIARQMGIPEQYKKLYFGSPEQIGLLEQQKKDAEAKIELYEEKKRDQESSVRQKASLEIDKYRAQQTADEADIETKRLQSKNYVTGMLAKMGALTTTGAAPLAITSLDAKYDAMKVATSSKYTYAIRSIEVAMNDDINDNENNYAEKEQAIREDLTKSVSDVTKELLKLKQDSDSKIYSITSSYAKTLKAAADKYKATLKSNANTYNDDFYKALNGGYSSADAAKIASGNFKGITKPVTKKTISAGSTSKRSI